MNSIEKFDTEFQKLYTSLVEISFEFLNRNAKEIDNIYVFGSIEEGFFYNVFFKINGAYVELHKVNTVSEVQYDISNSKMFSLLNLGNQILFQISKLFQDFDREIPTFMKMNYSPQTGKFENKIGYELLYSNHKEKTADDVFEEWFDEIKKIQ